MGSEKKKEGRQKKNQNPDTVFSCAQGLCGVMLLTPFRLLQKGCFYLSSPMNGTSLRASYERGNLIKKLLPSKRPGGHPNPAHAGSGSLSGSGIWIRCRIIFAGQVEKKSLNMLQPEERGIHPFPVPDSIQVFSVLPDLV